MSWRRLGAGMLVLVTTACASASPEGSDAASPTADECVTGVVVSEGMDMAPRTLVDPGEDAPVELLGVFAANVRYLTGATVRVCGPDRTPTGALEATRVTLLEVDGMPASLGTLRETAAGWMLEPLDGGDPARLAGVATPLRRGVGSVVWVAGPTLDGAISVRSFAVLERWR